uniref:Uncharacterized protein n=1 Tax=viral metagenome TaxID=1070528 RepID=A0A6C0I004_9ZZZZ
MSRSLSSAKQRRAGVSPQAEIPKTMQNANNNNSSNNQPGGLTLPQVIALIDTRLSKLETFVKKAEMNPVSHVLPSISEKDENIGNFNEIIDDFQQRFIMLATEIGTMKDTIMKLQTYTMDVNKMLLEERVNILSDLGDDNKSMFLMQTDSLNESETLNESEIEKYIMEVPESEQIQNE